MAIIHLVTLVIFAVLEVIMAVVDFAMFIKDKQKNLLREILVWGILYTLFVIVLILLQVWMFFVFWEHYKYGNVSSKESSLV